MSMPQASAGASYPPAHSSGPNLLVRVLWFILIGWWAGLIWSVVALLLEWTIIGLPLAAWMFNRLPWVMTLKPEPSVTVGPGLAQPTSPAPFLLRALWFLLIGWWLSTIWLVLAYAIGVTIIGLPLMFWMVNRIPMLATLSAL